MSGELIEEFLEREERRVAESTFRNRRNALNRYEEFLDDTGNEIRGMGHLEFEDFIAWLQAARGVSDRTAYQYLVQVWALHDYLDKRGEDVEVPNKEAVSRTLEIQEGEAEKHVPKSERSLTPDEMDAMVGAASRFKDGLIMRVLASTGMRPQDLRDLRLRDVDEDYRWLHVRSSKTATRRRVPIPKRLRQNLRLWVDHGYREACASAPSSDYLIPGENAEQLGRRTISQAVHDAAVEAGIQEELYTDAKGDTRYRITPYSFRYGYGNHMKNKVDPERLQTLMGHKSVTTTLEFYNSASEEELAEAGDLAPDPG